MVKLLGPLLGSAASGTLASHLNFMDTPRCTCVRRKPIPKQPRSGLQVSMRLMLSWLTKQWAALLQAEKETWLPAAAAAGISAFNRYCQVNMRRYRRGVGVTKQFPATEAGTGPAPVMPIAIGYQGYARVITAGTMAFDGWLWGFHRSLVTPFASGVENLVDTLQVQDGVPIDWYDFRLDPATYYYRISRWTDDGLVFHDVGPYAAVVT